MDDLICGCGVCDECVPAYDDGGDDWMKEEAEVEKASVAKNNQEVSMWEFDFEVESAAYMAWHRRKLERKLERLERTIRDEYERGAERACPVLMRRALEIRAQLG